MLKKTYEQGKDLHVATYLAYGKTDDHKLYADEAHKETATSKELADAFAKGRLLIAEGENVLVPVAVTAYSFVTVAEGTAVKWTASKAD